MTQFGRLLSPNEPEWDVLAESLSGDVYHLAGYAHMSKRQERARAMAFVYEQDQGRVFLPFVVRPIPNCDYFDLSSFYGYPGPLVQAEGDKGRFLAEAMNAFERMAREQDWVSAFLRLHPLLNDAGDWREAVGQSGAARVRGETVSVDLKQDQDALWRNVREQHRRHIQKMERSGFEFVIDEEWKWLSDFEGAYAENMRRVGARDFYFFDRDYFADLRAMLGPNARLGVALADGKFAAGAIFFLKGPITQYHLGGVRDEYLRMSPLKLLLWGGTLWAKSIGADLLHLGSGLGGKRDSLFEFKEGFGQVLTPFSTVELLFQPDVADRIERARFPEGAYVQAPDDGFFPAYRRPIPEPEPEPETA